MVLDRGGARHARRPDAGDLLAEGRALLGGAGKRRGSGAWLRAQPEVRAAAEGVLDRVEELALRGGQRGADGGLMAEERSVALPGRGGVLYGLVGETEAEGPARRGGGCVGADGGASVLDLAEARGNLAAAGGLELLERGAAVGAGGHLGVLR